MLYQKTPISYLKLFQSILATSFFELLETEAFCLGNRVLALIILTTSFLELLKTEAFYLGNRVLALILKVVWTNTLSMLYLYFLNLSKNAYFYKLNTSAWKMVPLLRTIIMLLSNLICSHGFFLTSCELQLCVMYKKYILPYLNFVNMATKIFYSW